MKNKILMAALVIAVLIVFPGWAATPNAAQKSPALAAPIPPQIGAAKKIFVANAGWDCGALDNVFHGAPNRVYDEFYFGLKRWGRYELMSTPDQADLDFAIRFACPPDAASVTNGNSLAEYDAKLILTISEAKGSAVLWRVIQQVKPAKTPKFRIGEYRDKDLSDTITTLIEQVKALAVPASASAARPGPGS